MFRAVAHLTRVRNQNAEATFWDFFVLKRLLSFTGLHLFIFISGDV